MSPTCSTCRCYHFKMNEDPCRHCMGAVSGFKRWRPNDEVDAVTLGRDYLEQSTLRDIKRLANSRPVYSSPPYVGPDRDWISLRERPQVTPDWIDYAHKHDLSYDALRVVMEIL